MWQAAAGPIGDAGDALVEGCELLSRELRELAAVQPATGSFFVRLFLGQVNVKVPSPADRETLRDEYNKFKDRTNVGIIFAGCVWGFTHAVLRHRLAYTGWIYSLTHLWLLYYYVSLALRENILRMVSLPPFFRNAMRVPCSIFLDRSRAHRARRSSDAADARLRTPLHAHALRRTARPSARGGLCTTTCRRSCPSSC